MSEGKEKDEFVKNEWIEMWIDTVGIFTNEQKEIIVKRNIHPYDIADIIEIMENDKNNIFEDIIKMAS